MEHDADLEAQVAMAILAGIVACPGIKHKPGIAHDHPSVICLICQGTGYTSTAGKSADTIRFWILWANRKAIQ